MKKHNWGLFVTEDEVDEFRAKVEQKGYEVFEVRKLTFWEKLQYCKDAVLPGYEMWVIMFKATRLQYKLLCWKLKVVSVF